MKQETFEITADSLQEARSQAKGRIPSGFFMLSEIIHSDGTLVTVWGVGETVEDAFREARARVPAGARIEHEEVIQLPVTKTVRIIADNEEAARKQAGTQLEKDFVIRRTALVIPGKRGILGIGKTQNQYDIETFKEARAVVRHKTNARLSVTIVDEICDGCCVTCGVCGRQSKVRMYDSRKISLLGRDAIRSMRSENIALKCQDCGFVLCFSCASPQTGSVNIPTCPSCKKEGGPYFFTKT